MSMIIHGGERVNRAYILIAPLDGFCRASGQEVTIPIGATVWVTNIKSALGLYVVLWGSEEIWLALKDVLKNGTATGDPAQEVPSPKAPS
jgi:hypothetical protein